MYIDYSKLWKLLIDKNMTKSDLMELTGISSRVLAKLSKNETVTTDTVARICEALECDVGDIMEYASESNLSVYSAYKKLGVCISENEHYKAIAFNLGDQKYVVYSSTQSANKHTQIHCDKDGIIYWVQLYQTGTFHVDRVKTPLIKIQGNDRETVIVLIKGKPEVIIGLDENGFVSSRGIRQKNTDVFVMSEAAFKTFSPKNIQ